MNAIEIKNLCKNFGEKQAVCNLNMTVPIGSIYGFIGENGSGKSTTEKMICGLIHPSSGEIKLYGRDYKDINVRAKMSCLIEAPGCFPNYSVWNNLMLQATNLSIPNKEDEVRKVLTLVRMEGAAGNKYKNCSLGMKQRIGIAMALLGDPKLLILDEPINGLDTDGMRIMREILVDLSKNHNITILISSHILGELEKIATHYGIIRQGKMIQELSAKDMDGRSRVFTTIKTKDMNKALTVLKEKFSNVRLEEENIRIYDEDNTEMIVDYLFKNGCVVSEVKKNKIGLEEYYIELMNQEGGLAK